MASFCECGSLIINEKCTNSKCTHRKKATRTVKKGRPKEKSVTKGKENKKNHRRSSRCITYSIEELENKEDYM